MDQKYTADFVIIGGGVIDAVLLTILLMKVLKKLYCWKREIFVQVGHPNPVQSLEVITQSKQICIMQLKVQKYLKILTK